MLKIKINSTQNFHLHWRVENVNVDGQGGGEVPVTVPGRQVVDPRVGPSSIVNRQQAVGIGRLEEVDQSVYSSTVSLLASKLNINDIASVTRLGDLLDFGALFKVFGNN